jgi:hypothetical protein
LLQTNQLLFISNNDDIETAVDIQLLIILLNCSIACLVLAASEVQSILEDPCATQLTTESDDFWVIVSALKDFVVIGLPSFP